MMHTAQDPAPGRLTASSTTAHVQTQDMMDESSAGTGAQQSPCKQKLNHGEDPSLMTVWALLKSDLSQPCNSQNRKPSSSTDCSYS